MNEFLRPLPDESAAVPATGVRTVTRACFADEIAIDFPALGPAIERVRAGLAADITPAATSASVTLTPRQAFHGTIVPLEVPLPAPCEVCGGRGESWSAPCAPCAGTGEAGRPHHVQLALPARISDGARFRFVVTSPHARPTRVEVTVSVA